jgi:hypothetical protein
MSTSLNRRLRLATVAAAAVVVLGAGTPARADDATTDAVTEAGRITCFASLKDCYYEAAGKASWVDMWLAGLDCELEFTDCTRRAIIGR